MGTVAVEGARSARPRQGVELRVWERHPSELEASCQPLAARGERDPQWPAVIRDVSTGGIGLVLSRRFERGTGLAIEVPPGEQLPGETLLARVVHATRLADGKWLLGCAFVSTLSEEELQQLLSLARSQRQAALPDESPAPAAVSIFGVLLQSVDRTSGKLFARQLQIRGSWPLAAGTTLRVWVGGKTSQRVPVTLRVHQCRLLDGRWTLHYSFVNPPSPDTLRLFALS